MSVQAIERKKVEVEAVQEKFSNAVSTVVVDYRGLTVSEMTELRSLLRAEGVELKVLKNNISSRAAKAANYEELAELFKGTTAVAFSNEDVVAPARIISGFAKKHEALELKGGTMEESVISLDEVKALAALPSRDGLLSMLLSVLQAPLRNLALVTKELATKAEEGGLESVAKEETTEAPASEEAAE